MPLNAESTSLNAQQTIDTNLKEESSVSKVNQLMVFIFGITTAAERQTRQGLPS